ncbi:MAG: hypothetical protein CMG00_00140 [Candidatus Marinimicrobia bacterium]|nr:hypothetical protein [Candidatus Neomarinimicrobiota bacterium]
MLSHDLIITTYNSYRYLNSLYSFVSQNIKKYSKIIIVDDYSDLDFYNLLNSKLNEFKNIILFRNKSNFGPSASRNNGIKISNAEYISFHDPDDFVCKERYDIINYYLTNFKPEVLFHDFTTTKLKKNIINTHKYKYHYGFIYLFKSLYVTPAFTCRRILLEKVGSYNEDIRYGEDLDLYIKLKNQSKFLFVNQELVKISSKSERIKNVDHLSSNLKLMRKSINKILISRIFPINLKSIFYALALVINILKKFID